MKRGLLLALVIAGGCPGDDRPEDGDTDTDTVVAKDTYETGLWPETDSDPWDDTADTDTAGGTDLIETGIEPCPIIGGIQWERDCNGTCFAPVNVGDGFCDHGPAPKLDLDCEAWERDGGDCVIDTAPDTALCGPGEVPDCNGNCYAAFLATDATCHDGPAPGVDFNCPDFGFDGGACVPDTGDTDAVDTDTGVDTDVFDDACPLPQQVRDCNGRCYPQNWLGDLVCDDGAVFPYGRPDFACARLEYDAGDCPVP